MHSVKSALWQETLIEDLKDIQSSLNRQCGGESLGTLGHQPLRTFGQDERELICQAANFLMERISSLRAK